MILKEIYIYGFKSFANVTKIELGPGVTTIVGPNGCGKSNVVDAIRWVLGEQSAKALRGGKMFDVIFAGSDKREPAQECEVKLLFTECEEQLGTAFNEVEVSRKVTREGASRYQLNGKNCRLKDIQRLFMDTGVGQESYSFLMQGKIDQILSNNPSERRIIFEEAAGITKYKAQRREALNKLAQVDQNLARVVDIVEEVSKRMGSLKRQASKAIRYKRIRRRLSCLELGHLSWDFGNKQEAVVNLKKELEGLEAHVEKAAVQAQALLEQCEEKKAQRSESAEALQHLQQEIFELKGQCDRLDNQMQLASVRENDGVSRIGQLEQECESLERQLEALDEQESSESESKQMHMDLVDSSDKVYEEKAQQVGGVEKQLREVEQEYRNVRTQLASEEGQLRRLEGQKSQLELSASSDGAKFEQMEGRIEETAAQVEQSKQKQEEAKAQADKQLKEVEVKQEVVNRLREQLDEGNGMVRELLGKVQEQDRKVATLNAQMGVLESLQEKLEGFSDGAKAILQGKLSSQEGEEFTVLTQALDVKEGYLEGFDALMGNSMDAIEVSDSGRVSQLFERLEEEGLGKACLHCEGVSVQGGYKEVGSLPQWLVSAASVVQVKDAAVKERWESLLSGCYIATDLNSVFEFLEGNRGFDFAYIATRNGELLDRRGFVYGGSKSGAHAGASYIQREGEIRELKSVFEKEKGELEQLQGKAAKVQEEREGYESQLETAKQELSQAQRQESEFSAEHRQANNIVERYESDLVRYRGEMERLKEAHERSRGGIEEVENSLKEKVVQVEQMRGDVERLEKNVDTVRAQRDREQQELSQLRLEAFEKKQKLEALNRELNELGNKRTANMRRQENLKEQMQKLRDGIVQYKSEQEEAKAQRVEVEETLKGHNERLEKAREGYKGIEGQLSELEGQLEALRKGTHEQESALSQVQVKLTKEESAIEYMLEKSRVDYEVELEGMDWRDQIGRLGEALDLSVDVDSDDAHEELEDEDEDIDIEINLDEVEEPQWDVVLEEVGQLRKRIQSMGAVNLVAIEEYRELKERHEFLTTQYEDLTASKDQLMKAIEEINEVSQKLFQETFDKVRTNFHATFDALFGGGHADLKLMESEDVLDAGIEVTARPPGTKLRSLSLLSGGQKTMTAVALLFAIYKVKPSPFCVLDELDAPLDDANIGRFTSMLKEFTRYSQFLVISHNKRTIACSDSLYGVTMAEKGVTKMLSMRFNNKAQKDADELEEIAKQAQETYVEAGV